MAILEKFSLGLNTTAVGMGIVFIVLICLWAVIVLESKAFGAVGGFFGHGGKEEAKKPAAEEAPVVKSGSVSGKAEMENIDDETAAVVLAAVGEYASVPLKDMQVKSIKAVK